MPPGSLGLATILIVFLIAVAIGWREALVTLPFAEAMRALTAQNVSCR